MPHKKHLYLVNEKKISMEILSETMQQLLAIKSYTTGSTLSTNPVSYFKGDNEGGAFIKTEDGWFGMYSWSKEHHEIVVNSFLRH